MQLVTYMSDINFAPAEESAVLTDIVGVAKRKNPEFDITGVLFYLEGKFLQVIEGPKEHITQLMHNISADKRHKNVDILIDTAVETRGFQQWNMDHFHLNSAQKFNAQTLRDLTASFQENLLPRSDMLVFFYKSLLEQKASD